MNKKQYIYPKTQVCNLNTGRVMATVSPSDVPSINFAPTRRYTDVF